MLSFIHSFLTILFIFKWLLIGIPWYKANVRYFAMQGTWLKFFQFFGKWLF